MTGAAGNWTGNAAEQWQRARCGAAGLPRPREPRRADRRRLGSPPVHARLAGAAADRRPDQHRIPHARVRELLADLTGKPVDDSVAVFPPFYSEFGKNLTLGKDVFINAGCRFQDTGGITIGDGSLIGHGSTLTTSTTASTPTGGPT